MVQTRTLKEVNSMSWKDIWRKQATDWTFGVLGADQVPSGLKSNQIEAHKAYVNIFVRSMRVVDVRKALKKFYGTVHSFITLPHIFDQKAEFHALTTPTQLSNIDAQNVDRIIQMNHRLLGPVPYRGGDLKIELGLFSIESVDYAGPFLKILESIATAAGVSYINKAIPFLGPLNDGVNLLFGMGQGITLEVGLSNTFDKPTSGYFVIIRAPKNKIDVKKLTLDTDNRLIDTTGEAITEYPYIVFSIEASEKREAWFDIPEIKTAYKVVIDAVRSGNAKTTQEAFTVFKRITLTSPDLLIDDAERLVTKVEAELKRVLRRVRGLTRPIAPSIIDLDKIDLYES